MNHYPIDLFDQRNLVGSAQESGMHIRRFRAGEEALLFQVFHSAVHLVASRDYSQEQLDAWAPQEFDEAVWIERIRRINPLVAEVDGIPVGYADIQVSGYIDHFFVSGNHPRQGIGRRLMDAIHDQATRLGVRELTSDVSRTAQPFFERFGFRIVEYRFPEIRGVLIPNARMRKQLA